MIVVRTPDARGPIPVEQKSPQPLIVYLVGQSIHILERARNSEVKRVANFRVSAKSVSCDCELAPRSSAAAHVQQLGGLRRSWIFFLEFGGWHGAAVEKALNLSAAKAGKDSSLLFVFDAFGRDTHLEIARERDDRADNRLVLG